MIENDVMQLIMVAAFPLLLGIVIHYAKKIVGDLKSLQVSHTQMQISFAELKGILSAETRVLNEKVISQQEQINSLKDRIVQLERGHHAS
jgi:hypothetical protein